MFGEEALVVNLATSATAVAEGPVSCVGMDRATFTEVRVWRRPGRGEGVGGDNKGVIAPCRLAHRVCVTLELKESGRGIARGVVAKRVAVTAVFAFIT